MRFKVSEFKTYLEQLPPGEAFCKPRLCPLMTWMPGYSFSSYEITTMHNKRTQQAPKWVTEFIRGVDGTPPFPNHYKWEIITPEECLDVLRQIGVH